MFPILFETSWLTIYSYPLFIGLAWGFGYQASKTYLIKNEVSLKGFPLLFWGNFVLTWIGAKLFFLIYSVGEDEFVRYAGSSLFWLGGGFVFYGGLIFGLGFTLFYTLVFKKFPIDKVYLFLAPLCFAHAIGRIGCLMAGCCFGTVCDYPWGIHHLDDVRHPVQLYEAIFLVVLGYLLTRLIQKEFKIRFIVSTYFIGYSVIRFILEFFRGDVVRGVHYLGLSTSQYISIVLAIAFALYLALASKKESGA